VLDLAAQPTTLSKSRDLVRHALASPGLPSLANHSAPAGQPAATEVSAPC